RHAANAGFPILGDVEYEGVAAPRLMLHARKLSFDHPATGERVSFEASVPRAFDEVDAVVAAVEFREPLFGESTNAFRLISGAADGFPDVIVDSYDGNLLVQWQAETAEKSGAGLIERLQAECQPRAIYTQLVTKQERTAPHLVYGNELDRRTPVRENHITFLINFGEGLAATAQEPPRAKTPPLPPAKTHRRLLAMARAVPRHKELIGPRPLADPLSMHSRRGPSSRACSLVPATARVPVPARVTRSELKRQRAREAAQLSGAGHSRAARVRAARNQAPLLMASA
ncbi:MAG: hypothetical protein ACLPXU_06745, partial [Acidimicrobiales bacterium]